MIRRRSIEWWICIVRLIAIPFAILQVWLSTNYPSGYERIAWLITAALVLGAFALVAVINDGLSIAFQAIAMTFDFAVISSYTVLYSFEPGTPTRQLLLLAVVAGAVRFGLWGGVAIALASAPVSMLFERRRSDFFHTPYRWDFVTFQVGAGLLMALLTGWLYSRLREQRVEAEQRAAEAEALRDELGQRVDLLNAANRCARALSSSLDLDEAFGAFIREVRGLVPFDRIAVVLAEDNITRVMATAGEDSEFALRPGSELELGQTLLAELVTTGLTAYRRDMSDTRYVEEQTLVAMGLHSRVSAPLLIGAKAVGGLSVMRHDADAFDDHEIELVTLLGRLVASAVQNIRAYEGERRTVEELRRLSALRADFVSLVSHELRSPMAAVIGAARTLQQRWRDLQVEQREAFLALIADETSRLATLIGDVLDTSRIDAGTFVYRFADIDLGALVRESVATAALAQSEVPLEVEVGPSLPIVRADPARLRQVLGNLIDNAVKYSPAGEPVQVVAGARAGGVFVSVADRGPGIPRDDQRLIFEKFGRSTGPGMTKPGSGLGLYIARAIAEAHGGTLDVTSTPGRGSTFMFHLPGVG